MKKYYLLPIILLSISSCKKQPVVMTAKSGFIVNVKQEKQLQSGAVVSQDVNALVLVWKVDGKDIDLNLSSDMSAGYIYDKTSGNSYKYDYAGRAPFSENAQPGRYFVYVIVDKEGVGYLAYSYTFFEINSGQLNEVTKIFSQHTTTGSYEQW